MKFKSDIEVQAGLKDSSGTAGTSGKILSSTGTGVAWVDDNPGITGSGTTNYVSKFTGASAIGNSLIFDNGTNVGIGTTSPAGKLSIVDSYYTTFFTDITSQYGSGLILSGDAGGGGATPQRSWRQFVKNAPGGVALSFEVSTAGVAFGSSPTGLTYSEKMRIAPSGNVGIGTTSPSKKLVVDGGSSDYTPIWAKSSLLASSKYYSSLLAGYALTANQSAQFGYVYDTVTPTNSYAHITPFGSAEGSKFMVRADGNVGIGNTASTSGYRLQVSGLQRMIGSSTVLNFGELDSNNSYFQSLGTDGATAKGFVFYGTGELMRITSGGNVGIGTTSPSYKLDVSTSSGENYIRVNSALNQDCGYRFSENGVNKWLLYNVAASDALAIYDNTASAERMRITSGGAIEIKNSDSRLLGGDTSGRLIVSNSDTSAYVSINGSANATPNAIGIITNSQITFNTGASYSERMRITSGGNVGIGTTSPSSKLTVNGRTDFWSSEYGWIHFDSSSTNQYLASIKGSDTFMLTTGKNGANTQPALLFGTSDVERMRITSGGNVLIGTTTDVGTKVNINGNTRISGGSTILQLHCTTGTAQNWWLGQDVSGSGDGTFYLYNQTSGVQSFNMTKSNNATFAGNVTATGFFNSSDNRLKELTDYDYNVSDIKPITYLWKDGRDNKKHVGYSAQEVQKVMPDAVNEGTDGMLSVNYVEVLVAQVNFLTKRIEELEKIISK